MKIKKFLYLPILISAVGLVWICAHQQKGIAEEGSKVAEAKYVGTQTCATCHEEVAKKWELTTHRRTLFNKSESKQGCEACHGPGSEHVAGGGDKSKIIRFDTLKTNEVSGICLKCHTQEHVSLWQTSTHARSKVSCINCHDPHSPGKKSMLDSMEGPKLSIESLSRAIDQAHLAANIEPENSPEEEAANKKAADLKAERQKLQGELKGIETIYQRTTEPYMCFNCHKAQEIQSRMPSHHPIAEGKVLCSSCHNPHGGPKGMLKQESVVETCESCHAEKVGPFTYDHPPVTEDCTTCHNPHGSVQNNLLTQSQPFLCLKCHAGPHTRSNALGTANGVARYYNDCTACHSQVHGSDNRSTLHY